MIRVLIILFTFLGFCFNISLAAGGDSLNSKRPIIIMGEDNFPPFSYIEKNGEYAGFSIDLTKEVMKRMGLNYEIKLSGWKSVIDSLDSKKADLVINMAYSEARDASYEFSTAFSYAKFNLISTKDSSLKYMTDLKGKHIIVQRNSIGEQLLDTGKCGCIKIFRNTVPDALFSVESGEADACILNSDVADYYIGKYNLNTLEVKQLSFGTLDNCFASYEGNKGFMRKINNTLMEINNDGTYEKIYEKWLSQKPKTFWEKYGFTFTLISALIIFLLVAGLLYYFYKLRVASSSMIKLNKDLVNSNAILNQIIKQIPIGVFIKDANENFKYLIVNDVLKSYKASCGKYEEGKNDNELFDTPSADTIHKDDLKVLEGNGATFQFLKTENCNGKTYIYSTHATMFSTPTGHRFIIGLVDDITDTEEIKTNLRTAKDKAEQSDKLKSAFLANMSHEIRTPLNSIVGFADLIGGNILSEEREEYLKIIKNNSELLLNLINDILDLSKIEAGMLEFHYEKFDLAVYFEDLAKSFKQVFKRPNIDMEFYNPYEECMVNYDKKRYTQVLTNFVSNAVKYTERGSIKIGYEIHGNYIRTYVEDTGIGIADDKQEKVFGRFEKLDNFAQGTGLGLAISKAIAEHNGGSIGFSSKKGRGSEFWFYIKKS